MDQSVRLFPFAVQRCVVGVLCIAVAVGFSASKVLAGDMSGIVGGAVIALVLLPAGADLLWSHVVVTGDSLVLVRLFRRRTITAADVARVEHALTARRKIRVQVTMNDGRSFEMDSTFAGRRRGTRHFYRRVLEVAPVWQRHFGELTS